MICYFLYMYVCIYLCSELNTRPPGNALALLTPHLSALPLSFLTCPGLLPSFFAGLFKHRCPPWIPLLSSLHSPSLGHPTHPPKRGHIHNPCLVRPLPGAQPETTPSPAEVSNRLKIQQPDGLKLSARALHFLNILFLIGR